MGKYLDSFKNRLKQVFDSGQISKTDLHRKTHISKSMIDRYLGGSEPGLHSLELIAEALNCDPRDLITPEHESIQKTHTIQDCLRVVQSLKYEETPDHNLIVKITPRPTTAFAGGEVSQQPQLESDIAEAVSLFRSLDKPERDGFLDRLRRATAARKKQAK